MSRSTRATASARRRRPPFQTCITAKSAEPRARGSHAPSGTFTAFATRYAASTAPNAPNTANARPVDQPQPNRATYDIAIDVAGHSVKRGDEHIPLTPLEFDLLVALARKPRQVFTREVLLEQVWGYRHAADTRLVNVHVQRLRAKIEKDPEHPEIVVTVRGVGYKAGPA